MFVNDFSAALLRKCINETLDSRCSGLLDIVIESINTFDGLIFGSTMTAYMLRDPSMKGMPARDLDVLFRDRESYDGFIARMSFVGHGATKRARPQGYESSMDITQQNVRYTFNNILATGDYTATTIVLKLFNQTDLNASIRVHAMYLQTGGSPQLTSINANTYVEELFNQFFVFDFTKVVYYQSKVYSKLSAINVAEVNMSDMSTATRQAMINKYTTRGITISIKSGGLPTELPELDLAPDTLKAAKDRYQALGLVVIPLTATTKHPAGKTPMVKGWMDKDHSYDFSVARCTNIGIVCGQQSGIVCIDVDQKDNGMYYFDRMIKKYGMPPCPTQTTPNGGRHYIFKYDHSRMANMKPIIKGANMNGNRVGIDLWIQRCQFVAEPSVNRVNNIAYKWTVPLTNRADIPALPEWIYDLYFSGEITEDGAILSKDEIAQRRSDAVLQETATFSDSIASSASSSSASPMEKTATAIPRRETTHPKSHMTVNDLNATPISFDRICDLAVDDDASSTRSGIASTINQFQTSAQTQSFIIDMITSMSWMTMIALLILAVLMTGVILLVWVVAMLILLIVPSNMRVAFMKVFKKLLAKALSAAE